MIFQMGVTRVLSRNDAVSARRLDASDIDVAWVLDASYIDVTWVPVEGMFLTVA
jgi:hypothetical protein